MLTIDKITSSTISHDVHYEDYRLDCYNAYMSMKHEVERLLEGHNQYATLHVKDGRLRIKYSQLCENDRKSLIKSDFIRITGRSGQKVGAAKKRLQSKIIIDELQRSELDITYTIANSIFFQAVGRKISRGMALKFCATSGRTAANKSLCYSSQSEAMQSLIERLKLTIATVDDGAMLIKQKQHELMLEALLQ